MYIAQYLCENYEKGNEASVNLCERVANIVCCETTIVGWSVRITWHMCSYLYPLAKYSCIKQVTELLDKLEFVFVPIVNPDGYEVKIVDEFFSKSQTQPRPSFLSTLGLMIVSGERIAGRTMDHFVLELTSTGTTMTTGEG